jgi:multiple sugar transport system permease protein
VAQDGRCARSSLVTAAFVAIVVVAAPLLNRGLRGSAVFRVLYVLPSICVPGEPCHHGSR